MDNIDERYKNGKIYIVKCKNDDNLKYVGSTIRELNVRLSSHRRCKDCSLYQFVKGDWDNFYIELYEEYPCNNKKELEKREGEVIRLVGTINYKIAGRTKKEYRKDNKEIITEKMKEYREANKEKIAENKKIYYENNKEILAEKKIEWYEKNKEKFNERKREKVKCDNCGFESLRNNISRHKKSTKCMEYKTST
jgi:hypothetical protein